MLYKTVELDRTSQPVDDSKYQPNRDPVSVYYGTVVKSMYDDDRLNISGGKKIKHKVVSLHDKDSKTKYIYGVKINNPLLAMKMYHDFADDMEKIDDADYIDCYSRHLDAYGMSCDESYSQVCRGLLCIDGVYLNDIAEDIPVNVFDVDCTDPQWFLRYASCHIYILH